MTTSSLDIHSCYLSTEDCRLLRDLLVEQIALEKSRLSRDSDPVPEAVRIGQIMRMMCLRDKVGDILAPVAHP